MAAPKIKGVRFVDPWGPLPPLTPQTGVLVTVEKKAQPDSLVLAAKLFQGATAVSKTGFAPTPEATLVAALPSGLLSNALPCSVAVQWVQPGSEPDWSPEPAKISSAPVNLLPVQLLGASVSGGNVILRWETDAPGAEAEVFEEQTGKAPFFQGKSGPLEGSTGAVPLTVKAGTAYSVQLCSLRPLDSSLVGSFAEPFARGPVSPRISIPPIGPVIATVSYDGESVAVSWGPVGSQLPVADEAYELHLLADGTRSSRVGADSGGGQIPLSPDAAGKAQVAGSVRFDAISGPVGQGQPVLAEKPLQPALAVAASSTTGQTAVTATFASLPAGTKVSVELIEDGTVVETKSASEATPPAPTAVGFDRKMPGGHVYELRCRLEGSAGSPLLLGPPAPRISVPVQVPAISFASILDGTLSMDWAPVPGDSVSGYEVTVGPSGNPATAETADTHLSVPVAAASLASGSLTVTPVGPKAKGLPASLPISAPYKLEPQSYDGSTLTVKLSGTLDPMPSEIWVDVVVEGSVVARARHVGAPGADAIAIPVALPVGTPASVRATGVGQGAITPPSEALPVPTSPPREVSAIYDGANLHVAWEPVADAGVGGYEISVAGLPSSLSQFVKGAATPAATIAVSIAQPLPAAVKVSVRAFGEYETGKRLIGPGIAAVAPTLAGFSRSVAVPAPKQPPYLYRHGSYQTLAEAKGADVVAYLPNPFTAASSVGHNTTNAYFSLESAGSGLPYKLTIDKAIWTSFNQLAVRSGVRDAYRAFLKEVEAKGVTPWGIPLVRQVIAAAMPQTFGETLYYRYGAWRDEEMRSVDLEPGLRLRLSGALWQVVTGDAEDPLNGYIAGGEETYELAVTVPPDSAGTGIDPASRSLSVDALLSLLYPGTPGPPTVNPTRAAGPVDFFGGNRQTYYRLLYPAAFKKSGDGGSNQLADNVTIIGAASWQVLEEATETFVENSFLPPGTPVFATYFRGRAALTPLLSATVGAEARWVPVGTTVRQLLASAGSAVWTGGAGGAVQVERVGSGFSDRSFEGPTLRREPVDLDEGAIAKEEPPLWPLDLPVLGGDAITVADAGS